MPTWFNCFGLPTVLCIGFALSGYDSKEPFANTHDPSPPDATPLDGSVADVIDVAHGLSIDSPHDVAAPDAVASVDAAADAGDASDALVGTDALVEADTVTSIVSGLATVQAGEVVLRLARGSVLVQIDPVALDRSLALTSLTVSVRRI